MSKAKNWHQGKKGSIRDVVFLVPWNESHGIPNERNLWIDCNNEENARLIAAAPDLLDALVQFVDEFEGCYADGEPAMIKARAAIAKATGKTQ